MKISLLLLTAAAGAIGLCDLCGPAALAQPMHESRAAFSPGASAAAPQARDTVTLHIEGMTCGGCTIATRRVLERLPGVTRADVSYEQKRAIVAYDPARVTVAQMIAAVETLKYTASVVAPAARP